MLECLQIQTRHKLSVLKGTVSLVSNYLDVIVPDPGGPSISGPI